MQPTLVKWQRGRFILVLCSGTENCQVTIWYLKVWKATTVLLDVIGVKKDCFSVLADGMAGQVSPEALFSRLQTEGSKTEAESEVRAQNSFRPKLLARLACLFTRKRHFQPSNASSRVESFQNAPVSVCIRKRVRSY